jgi:ABC-type glycerol-3-phosphate transport system substrate-binding protein
MKYKRNKRPFKRFWLLFVLVALITLSACTFQSGQPAPPTIPTQSTSATLENGSTVQEENQTAVESPEPSITEEINVPEATGTVVVDDLASIDPTGQHVYFWYFAEPQSPIDQALNQVVDQFNQTNPNGIFIDAYNQSTAQEVISRTLPLLNTPDVPALLMTNPEVVYRLATGISDLEPFLTNTKWGFSQDEAAQLIPGMLEQVQYPEFSSGVYAFPISRDAELLFNNLEWLSDLDRFAGPLSPQELADTACAATNQSMRRLQLDNLSGLQLYPGLNSFAALTAAFGGSIFQPEQTNYALNTDASFQAMQYLQKLSLDGCLDLADDYAHLTGNFSRAETAFILGAASDISEVQQTVSQDLAFAWDVSGFPAQDGTAAPLILPGVNLSITNTTPEQMLAAWTFIQYFQSSEAQNIWIPATGEFPALGQAGAEAAMPAGYFKTLESLQNAPAIPVFPGIEEIDQLVHDTMGSIADGAAVQPALDALQRSAEQTTDTYFDR